MSRKQQNKSDQLDNLFSVLPFLVKKCVYDVKPSPNTGQYSEVSRYNADEHFPPPSFMTTI